MSIKRNSPTIYLLSTLIAFCLFFPLALADEIPSPPHRFKGYVITETGELASNGTIILAKLNNIFYNTTVKNGTYGFPTETEAFYVNGSEGDGDILFYINGALAQQTATFEVGGLNIDFKQYLNLSLDTTAPLISLVTSSSITSTQAIISWTTDELSNSTVNYGTTTALGLVNRDGAFMENHSLTLASLQPFTTYYYEVISYDYSGHITRNNNSGAYYHFITEQTQGGNGDNGGAGGGMPPLDDTNHPPLAHANGPYYGLINKPVTFDASQSNDTDGYIVNYSWSLGDGTIVSTNQVRITHTFLQIENYTVILTVADNKGAKNSTTTKAYISTNDTDGDGWSNDAEEYYGTNPNNAFDYPIDSDDDGIPDNDDADDDNDGLSDTEELLLGTNPANSSDVFRLLNEYGLFLLIDTNQDIIFDFYYNQTTGLTTVLGKNGTDVFLIDVNGDHKYEFQYNVSQNQITPYAVSSEETPRLSLVMIMLGIGFIIVFILLIFIAYHMKNKLRKNNGGDESHEKK